MRKVLCGTVALAAIVATGCVERGLSGPTSLGGVDPAAPRDLAGLQTRDLAGLQTRDLGDGNCSTCPPPSPKIGCHAIVDCYNNCSETATTEADYNNCTGACDKTAKSESSTKFAAAQQCVTDACTGNVDAMSGHCRIDGTGNLINRDGTMIANSDPTTDNTGTKDCLACLSDGFAAFGFGFATDPSACYSMSDVDCKPAACTAAAMACTSDM